MKHFLWIFIFAANVCQAQAGTDTTGKKDTAFGKKKPDVQTGEKATKEDDSKVSSILSPLINYNFTGQDKGLANLTPSIDYGFSLSVPLGKKGKRYREDGLPKLEYVFEGNPYVAGQIDVKDSMTYLPALMLPGNAGVRIDNYLNWRFGKCMLSFFPFNFGLKFMTNFTDSSKTIVQHNIRSGFAFTVSDLFVIGFQHTYGWHNASSASEAIFDTLFKRKVTDIRYVLISVQMKISKNIDQDKNPDPAFLFVEWRSVLKKDNWDFPNKKIITLGIRKDISFRRASPAKGYDKRYKPDL